MRAMSAPIRANPPQSSADIQEKLQSNVHNSNSLKRRMRRKKISPSDINKPMNIKMNTTNDQTYVNNKIVNHRLSDERSFAVKQAMSSTRTFKAVKPSKLVTPSRAKSTSNGCDIETLVSLLSPGGSDSEKEDYVNTSIDGTSERNHHSLRKVGKSGNHHYAIE